MQTIDQVIKAAVAEAVTTALAGRRVSPRSQPVYEPTWTNEDGVTRPLHDLATPYLHNIRRLAITMALTSSTGRNGSGLADAIDAELARRGE